MRLIGRRVISRRLDVVGERIYICVALRFLGCLQEALQVSLEGVVESLLVGQAGRRSIELCGTHTHVQPLSIRPLRCPACLCFLLSHHRHQFDDCSSSVTVAMIKLVRYGSHSCKASTSMILCVLRCFSLRNRLEICDAISR